MINISLNDKDILMIVEALEGLQQDVKHSNDNGYSTNYPYSEQEVNNLLTKLDDILEND
jgi:hypothetical protein